MKLVNASLLLSLISSPLFAKAVKPATGGFAIESFLPTLLIMFAVIYFMMIMPERKKQKAKVKMLDELKKGDKVISIGGIAGTVHSVKNDGFVMVRVADNTVIKVLKSSISSVNEKTDDSAKIENKKKNA